MFGNIIGIETDIICILISVIMLFSLQVTFLLKTQVRMFRALLIWFSIFCFTGTISHVIPADKLDLIRLVVCLKTITCSFIGYYWFNYTFFASGYSTYSFRRWRPILIAPAIGVGIYGIFDFFNHLHDATLYLSPYFWMVISVIGAAYFLFASLIALRQSTHTTNPFHKAEYSYLSLVALVPIIALIVQFHFSTLDITAPTVILAILHIYIFRLVHQISTDPSTGLNNKYKMAHYLSQITRNQNLSKRLFFIRLTIDYYDKIQKKYGLEKTNAIMEKVAKFLKKQSINQCTFLARFDKDKFAIICEKTAILDMEFMCNEILRNCEKDEIQTLIPWKISFNVYWAEYGTEQTQTIDTWLKHVDEHCIQPPTRIPVSSPIKE